MSENEAAAEYAIDRGWLVEVVNEHTCGTAAGGYYGAHEPGCGMVPVARIDDLLSELADAHRVLESLRALAVAEPDCWVFRVPAADGLACTDLIGGRIGAGLGQEFTVDMCCLPCRIRAVLPPTTPTPPPTGPLVEPVAVAEAGGACLIRLQLRWGSAGCDLDTGHDGYHHNAARNQLWTTAEAEASAMDDSA